MKAKGKIIQSDGMERKEQTDLSWVEFDGHLSGIGTTIEDGDYDLLIGLIKFMSVGVKSR
jgi:hypothetical protein